MVDPVIAVIVVLALVIALGFGGTMLTDRANRRDMKQVEESRREERANQERLEQEHMARMAQVRKEEAGAMDAARRRMAFAEEGIHQAKQSFKDYHDQLIQDIHLQAKAGCDALFQQRFGITRPPKAPRMEDDPEVQEYLREHYAELRDETLARTIDRMMQDEVDRRIAAMEEPAPDDPEPATGPDFEPDEPAEPLPASIAEGAPGEAESEAESVDDGVSSDDEPESETVDDASADIAPVPSAEAEPDSGQAPDAGDEPDAEIDDAPATDGEGDSDAEQDASEDAGEDADEDVEPEPAFDRAPVEDAVREEFDLTSVRTYLLAAISARYDEDGRPIGELPWPAYTSLSTRGYGELVLAEGSPVYAQDAYREFAWKRFHTGRRAEKPQRGEYSWPASHELGDGVEVQSVPTPAGVFSVEGPAGTVALYELLDCAWMRHSLEYQGALLEPDRQRSFFVNLEGLHKDDELRLRFDGPDFLEEAEDGPYFLNAMGEVNGAYVGLSASKPEAANVGEAPYALTERSARGFVFKMTHDARRHDVDTHPQFLEVHVAWCQPPAPRPERIVRHVVN